MTFKTCLIRALVTKTLYGLVLVAALVALNATEDSTQSELPNGVSECWNPHTAQITIVEGPCPTPVNPY